MSFKDIDIAALSFAMAIHLSIDYRSDKILAENSDEASNEMQDLLDDYIKYFCAVYQEIEGKKAHEIFENNIIVNSFHLANSLKNSTKNKKKNAQTTTS